MADSISQEHRGILGRVTHSGAGDDGYVSDAEVQLLRPSLAGAAAADDILERTWTDPHGRFRLPAPHQDGSYRVVCTAFNKTDYRDITVTNGTAEAVALDLPLGFTISPFVYNEQQGRSPAIRAVVGRPLVMSANWDAKTTITSLRWITQSGVAFIELDDREVELMFARSGRAVIEAAGGAEHHHHHHPDYRNAQPGGSDRHTEAHLIARITVSDADVQMVGGNVAVTLNRTASEPTRDQALWVAIRNRTDAISFGRYRHFINRVLRWEEIEGLPGPLERRMRDLGTHMHGVGAYQLLKTATEIFLLLECGVRIDPRQRDFDLLEEQSRLGEPITAPQIADRLREYLGTPPQLPYITRVVEAAFPEFERVASARDRILLTSRINEPCLLEFIWCYWHEEGMLNQTINAISRRFQNMRRSNDRDPLLNLEIDPLRPVNNLLWGFIQDEVNQLSVARRAYEYQHEYGLTLYGKAVPNLQPADSRSKFVEAFNNLLYQSSVFFKEDFQTTVIADGFPLLNALKEVHLILAQGAHNQFGDLPWTARAEMLLTEYILSRPEIRDFLQSRVMVPYKEAWMPQVDMMKTVQGWTDVTVTHFRDLGVYGEQLLLSIRYGDWIDINDENSAKNWARYWRPELQGYLHAYRAATGIDLTNPDTVDATIPAVLLQKRLALQHRTR